MHNTPGGPHPLLEYALPADPRLQSKGTRVEASKNKLLVFCGFIGIMEKKMETTTNILGLYRKNGKENGNHY